MLVYYALASSESSLLLSLIPPELTKKFDLGIQAKDKTTEESRISVCIFDDMTEQCCEAALSVTKLWEARNLKAPIIQACSEYKLSYR
ncbi:uncharacterized protein LOC110916358 isoform X3 [Helianthus annuus]|uniref:uncharacterized protein LOC110916358 isoform X3 n=1 Tax=Helianthus annuus TaxID=4232 RepID=UPI000B8F817B|nr:uncharacterized protein LOC110916358 isoform X3 [Helianthus annuus]